MAEFLDTLAEEDFQCFTTVTTRAEFLDFHRRLIMTESLLEMISPGSEVRLPSKVRAQIQVQQGQLRRYEQQGRDAVFFDSNIKRIKSAMVDDASGGLGEPLERVIEILDFLKTRQLIRDEKGALIPTSQHIFIDRSSPFVGQHHRNWRMQAIRSASRRDSKNLHLSLAVTMSEQDAALLRNRIAEFIEEISSVIKASPEEKLMSIGVDFFEL